MQLADRLKRQKELNPTAQHQQIILLREASLHISTSGPQLGVEQHSGEAVEGETAADCCSVLVQHRDIFERSED